MKRRKFFEITGGSLTLLTLSPIFAQTAFSKVEKKKIPIIIDADTANEIDDLYAIARALLEPQMEVLALSSGQWGHRLSPENTVEESQKLNEDILRLMNREDIPAPLGSNIPVGMPWGGTEPRETAATETMIKLAREMPDGKKLIIVSLGAVTNVASAIKLAPDIVPKIDCYFLSSKFFSEKQVWDKDEFNARRDLNALNVMFNTKGLSIHVMPVNILYNFRLKKEDVMNRLENQTGIWDYLAKIWEAKFQGFKEWIFWDLALMIAIIKPQLAEEGEFMPPPENKQRKINVYTKINVDKMLDDWWGAVDKDLKK